MNTPYDTNRPKNGHRETLVLWIIAIVALGIVTWLADTDRRIDKAEAANLKKQVSDYCAIFPAAALCLAGK
jgi:hypothetical protein